MVPTLEDAVSVVVAARVAPADPDRLAAALLRIDGELGQHQAAVYGMCLRIVGDPERARELAQDALLVAWRKLDTFRADGSFRSWVLGIARFKAIRAVAKRRETLTDDGVLDATDDCQPVLDRLQRAEREELLRAASVAVLDPTEQEAVYLRYVEGVPQDRISEILGVDGESGARGLLQRCRRKLGRELRRRLAALGHGSSFVRSAGP